MIPFIKSLSTANSSILTENRSVTASYFTRQGDRERNKENLGNEDIFLAFSMVMILSQYTYLGTDQSVHLQYMCFIVQQYWYKRKSKNEMETFIYSIVKGFTNCFQQFGFYPQDSGGNIQLRKSLRYLCEGKWWPLLGLLFSHSVSHM